MEQLTDFWAWLDIMVPNERSREQYKSRIRQMLKDGLTAEQYLAAAKTDSTFNARRAAVRHLLAWAQRSKRLEEFFPDGWELPAYRDDVSSSITYVGRRQMREMMDKMSLRDRVAHIILVLEYCGGLRRAEVRNLKISDVVLTEETSYVIVRNAKHREGKSDNVELGSYAALKLARYLQWRTRGLKPGDPDWLVIGKNGGQYDCKFRDFIALLEECYKDLGIPMPKRPCHNNRKLCGTHLAESPTVNMRTIQSVLRHKSMVTTQRYLGVTPAVKRAALDELGSREPAEAEARAAV